MPFKLILPIATLFLLSCIATAQPPNFFDPNCKFDHVCMVYSRALSDSREIREYLEQAVYPLGQRTGFYSGLTGYTKTFSAYAYSNVAVEIQAPSNNPFVDQALALRRPLLTASGWNIYAGLNACYQALSDKTGNRVIVLVSSGRDLGVPKGSVLASEIKSKGISIVTSGVSVFNEAARNYLKSLATTPDFYIEPTFKSIRSDAIALADLVCSVSQTPVDTCQKAYEACDFKFNNKNTVPTYSILNSVPDMAFTDAIVSKSGPRIGIVNSNGITPEFINADGSVIPIKWTGNPRYSETHFKPVPLKSQIFLSGVAHQAFTGGQKWVARNRCVRVYFTTYQTITSGSNPTVLSNVNVDKSDRKCVVFKTV